VNWRQRAEERATMARLDAIHEEIMAIPEGPCESFEERYQRYLAEAQERIKWQVFTDAGAKPRRR
jgi:hypothetical protein